MIKHTRENIEYFLRINTIIDKNTNCWLYQGSQNRKGHCQIQYNNKAEYIHRLSAMLHFNYDLNDGENQINHKCENSNCWNPDHIYIGTQFQNMKDLKNSDKLKKDYCQRGHRILGIRLDGRKFCVECKNESQRIRRSKIKELVKEMNQQGK